MTLLVLILIVIVCLVLALYAVQLLPLPATEPPLTYLKPLLMVLCVVVAILVIANKAGLAL